MSSTKFRALTGTRLPNFEPPSHNISSFGSAVAIEEQVIAVTTGGSETNNPSSADNAFQFMKGCSTGNGTEWVLRNFLRPSEGLERDSFGSDVNIIDGYVIVGSSNPRAVYLFNVVEASNSTCTPV